nr:Cox3 [Porphyridium aerugineum]
MFIMLNLVKLQRFGFHLVDLSPWPLFAASSVLFCTLGTAAYFHGFVKGSYLALLGCFNLITIFIQWFRDINREAVFEGAHSSQVQQGLRLGMLLFIVSEALFFVGFFWGFFHSALSPNIELGAIWPPKSISTFNPWQIPFLNTLILLLSGVFVTWSHHAILQRNFKQSLFALFLTILLACIFTCFQILEYKEANFRFADGIYGAIFFLSTGFHALHVIIGTIFLTVCFLKLWNYQLTQQHHFSLEAAIWYWHFVDVVWLFLFICVYWWGGL